MSESFTDYLKKFNALPKKNTKAMNIAVLRSYTCEMFEPIFAVTAAEQGIPCTMTYGGFNQFRQELLDPASFLYATDHDALFLSVMLEDLCPDVVNNYYSHNENIDSTANNILNTINDMLTCFRARSNAPILFCNFIYPYFAQDSSYHSQHNGMRTLIHKLNACLPVMLNTIQNSFVVDLEKTIYEIGANASFDCKMMQLAHNPFTVLVYTGLARRLTALLGAIVGKRKKCIVVDCDNTLWEGIVGEDGISGIQINENFREFQRQLLNWKNTGILLAVCSKNNQADVEDVFNNHPDMLLSLKDFAAFRINWSDKANNIRQMSEELNIGIDSFIFVDDSEFECNLVQETLPGVEVIHLKGQSFRYAEIISRLPSLNFVSLTEEDTQRTSMYLNQKQREELFASQTDLKSYLSSLNMTLKFSKVDKSSISRAAQMTQKTNQFNLTTKRYTEQELLRLEAEGHLLIILRVSDKFGDNGLTGLMIIDLNDHNSWKIDTFLLSCRVMGRTVEHAFLGFLVDFARRKGVKEIVGQFIPTLKNKPVELLYQQFGFEKNGDLWFFDVRKGIETPAYFTSESSLG